MTHTDHPGLAEHRAALATSVSQGDPVPAGRLFGLPELPGDDAWCDLAGASVIAGVGTATIMDWLRQDGPDGNPFPSPARILCRLYWTLSAIDVWKTAEVAARC